MSDPELDSLRANARHQRNRAPVEPPAAEPKPAAEPSARVQDTRKERRRRRSEDLTSTAKNLHVPRSIREDAERRGLVLRWIRNDPMRVESKTRDDDWEPITDSQGQHLVKSAGRGEDDGKLMLVGKPEEFEREDRQAKHRRLREILDEEHIGSQSMLAADDVGKVNYDRGTKIAEWSDADLSSG